MTKKITSKINGTLEITWIHGKKVLNSATANYSYGSLQRILEYGLSKIYFDNKASILILGMGGGSVIDTLINRYKHRGHITAIEIDPVIIELAKSEFDIIENKNLTIISKNALEYVANSQNTFDLIIMDLFIDQEVPPAFYKIQYWDQLITLMKPKGSIIFNAGIQLEDDASIQPLITTYSNSIEFQLHSNVHGINTLLIGRKK